MNNKKNKGARDIGFYILILIILLATIFILFSDTGAAAVDYSQVRRLFEQEQVEYFVIDGSTLILSLHNPYEGSRTVTHELLSVSIFYEDMNELIDAQMQSGVLTDYNYKQASGSAYQWMLSLLPYLFVAVIMIGGWFFILNRSGMGGGDKGVSRFGKAKTRLGSEETKKVTFNDVAGADEEKEELQEIVEFLKEPKRFVELGARIPKGVLLVGPPGTGKTLLAKAVAGEADVQFLSISGSDFVELYVGVGASRVRDLFDQAKKAAPSIIFIDEIDAVGRSRGAGLGGGHDEREQTLNQLLVEMDGFGNNEGVIVMAATNRSDILDNALLRPGRFDRQIYVGRPDIRGREEILKIHARGKPLGEDVDLRTLAKGTPGFTGADLENLLNEAALLAARKNRRFITMHDLEDAMIKVIAGPEKKSRVVIEKERRLTAYHEAGHAVVINFLETQDPVHQITIVPRGMAGGMTIHLPQEDRSYRSKSEMYETIVGFLGGRVAEKLILDDISTGASSDIQQASSIARDMITKYGMSDVLGPISFDSSSHSVFIGRDFSQTKSYSEKIAAQIDDEVKHLFDDAYVRCEALLTEHRELLVKTAEYLLENEVMDGETFAHLCEHGELPPAEEKPAEEMARDGDNTSGADDAAPRETELRPEDVPPEFKQFLEDREDGGK